MTAVASAVKTRKKGPEELFQDKVLELAKALGWWVYHPYDSRRSAGGWPDLVLMRTNPDGTGQALFRELKSARGVVSPAQQLVLGMLRSAGMDAGVWRPCDLDNGVIAGELARIGARRGY
jgi:hypothetical protein